MAAVVHLLLMLALPLVFLGLALRIKGRAQRGQVRRWYGSLGPTANEDQIRGRVLIRRAANDTTRGAKLAAETTWVTPSRHELGGMRRVLIGRAPRLVLVDDDGEVDLAGQVEVTAGSQLRWDVRGRYIDGTGYRLDMTVASGDPVRAFGRLIHEADHGGDAASYRDSASRRRLEPTEELGVIRVMSVAPRVAHGQRALPRAVMLAMLPLLGLALSAAWSFAATVVLAERTCGAGNCEVVPTWRWRSLPNVVAGWLRGRHFERAPSSAAACRASSGCLERGDCSIIAAADESVVCGLASDEDCRSSIACLDEGRCSRGGGQCVIRGDHECELTDACFTRGQCVVSYEPCGFAGCQPVGECHVSRFLGPATPVGTRSERDCRGGIRCKKLGQCTNAGDGCLVASDADCQGSEVCARYGWCLRATGGTPSGTRRAACFNARELDAPL